MACCGDRALSQIVHVCARASANDVLGDWARRGRRVLPGWIMPRRAGRAVVARLRASVYTFTGISVRA